MDFGIYREIIKDAKEYIKGYGSYIMFEIGSKQKQDVITMLLNEKWKIAEVRKDFEKRDRCIIAER